MGPSRSRGLGLLRPRLKRGSKCPASTARCRFLPLRLVKCVLLRTHTCHARRAQPQRAPRRPLRGVAPEGPGVHRAGEGASSRTAGASQLQLQLTTVCAVMLFIY